MIENASFTVARAGERLDAAVLAAFPSTTRSLVRDAVSARLVLVGGREAKKGMKLRGGETVRVVSLAEKSDVRAKPDGTIPLAEVYADEAILAYDKPAGIPVQPLSMDETGTLMNAVAFAHPECVGAGDDPLMAGAVHRIDAGTSGLVIVARTRRAFDSLREQFAAHTVEKKYLALVEGRVENGGLLDDFLVHDPRKKECVMLTMKDRIAKSLPVASLRPMHAVTGYAPLAVTKVECEERTLLEVTIKTGVTHQIRAQLAAAGMHIVNDTLYGAFPCEGMKGHALHSLSARFIHPETGKETVVSAPPPLWAGDAKSGGR